MTDSANLGRHSGETWNPEAPSRGPTCAGTTRPCQPVSQAPREHIHDLRAGHQESAKPQVHRGADSAFDRARRHAAARAWSASASESRESFASTVSGTDLIVGARSSPVHLLLFSVFRIGNATNNIAMGQLPRHRRLARRSRGRFPFRSATPIAVSGCSARRRDYFEHFRFARRPQARVGAGPALRGYDTTRCWAPTSPKRWVIGSATRSSSRMARAT